MKRYNKPFIFFLFFFVALPITIFSVQKAQTPTLTTRAAEPQPVGPGGSWTLVFNDEFNGTSLDATKWSVCYPWDCHSGGNGELMEYAPNYAAVNSGLLTITAVNQKTCGETYCANYGASLIQTGVPKSGGPAKFTFTYGFAEARLQTPYGTGYFPAFWLLGPQSEIDLMEVFGNSTWFSCGVHLGHYSSKWSCPHHGTNTPGSWHTFGVDWEPNQMTFYYDGSPIASTTDPSKIPSDAQYILLNFAIGANFLPPPDSSTVFPAYFNADYVRVWKQGPATSTLPPQPSRIPSATPIPVPVSSCTGNGVYLYRDSLYRGDCIKLTADSATLKGTTVGNTAASSIKIVGNYTATVFQETNYRGKSMIITADTPRLTDTSIGNDRISSVKIVQNTSVPAQISDQSVTSFMLYDADRKAPIKGVNPLHNGSVLSLSQLATQHINIKANTNPQTVGSVLFGLDGSPNFHMEDYSGYYLAGKSGDYWNPRLGQHTITATPYTGTDGTGTAGASLSITFTIVQ